MKVAGFTFIRNAIKYDYPIVEAIRSILPLCDEVVVAVGDSDDGTLELIRSIAPEKIKIIQTSWDDSLREGGKVLAVETDKAFKAIDPEATWAIYIQGDEVLHEKYYPDIREALDKYKDRNDVDGLLLDYLHFYGSYDYVGDSADWYPKEIRIVRNSSSIYSYKDAQGFRKGNNEKLRVVPVVATMHHYGWVKEPKAMQGKQEDFNKLWHDDDWVSQNIAETDAFDYGKDLRKLSLFTGSHPLVMEERIAAKNWTFAQDISMNKRTLKDQLKLLAKNWLGLDFGYRNYVEVKG